MSTQLLEQLKPSYANLWGKMVIKHEALPNLQEYVENIKKGIDQYKAVEAAIGVPWRFVGIIHCMECDCSFKQHLHNGDPLTARTVQVPEGRPLRGNPPFAWHDSAIDALTMRHLSAANDWSIEGILFQLEAYNGWGYRNHHGINTPYLWSGSNEYTSGKYVADGKFDPNAVSKQVGGALLLKYLL
jgi:lysozyme family protein